MVQRKILSAANGFEQEFAERNRYADFGNDVFLERAEKIEAPGGIVEDGRSDLRQLARHPQDGLLEAASAHLGIGRAEALAGLDQLGSLFKLALRQGALAQHHFAEAVVAVATGGEH